PLSHAERRSCQGEEAQKDRNDPEFLASEFGQNAVQQSIDCTGCVEHAKCSTNDEQEEDDLGSVGHSRQNRGEKREWVGSRRINRVVGATDVQFSARLDDLAVLLP